MPMYLLAILATVAESVLHGWANILDSFFSNSVFRRLSSLVFFSSFINLILVPIIILIDPPKMLSPILFFVILLIAVIEIGYQYPYYWALQDDDTSIVVSLFSVGDLFTPLLAFLFLGEHLAGIQYAGFFLVTASSVFLTLDPKKLKFNPAALLMFMVSIVLTIQTILYKYAFEAGANWGSVIVWVALFQFVIASVSLLVPKNARDLSGLKSKLLVLGKYFVLSEVLTWAGEGLGTFALLIIPVTMEKGITGLQPIFVLVFALVFAKKFPHLFKEHADQGDIAKKISLFILMALGVILITL